MSKIFPAMPGISAVESAGIPASEAAGAMILVHGRGASAGEILSLRYELPVKNFSYLAPQAQSFSWYPYSFLAPTALNEPGLTDGLSCLQTMVEHLNGIGIDSSQIVLAGFSQGACLISEFAARSARHYGAILILSGGLIGPPDTERTYSGEFHGTPTFIGCNEDDPHIPAWRVKETAEAFSKLGASVEMKLYSGDVPDFQKHTIVDDELLRCRKLLAGLRSM